MYVLCFKVSHVIVDVPRGIVAHVLYCDIVVSGIDLQSRYYVYFLINTLKKDVRCLIPRGMR